MINSFLAIIDRILKLLTIREKRFDRLFSELWEPTFADLLIVHRNYVEIFEKARAMLGSLQAGHAGKEGSETYIDKLAEISQYLSQQRIEFEPVRRKLIALIDAVEVTDLDNMSKTFVEALVAYFPTGTPRRVSTEAAEVLSVIEAYRKSILDASTQNGPDHMSVNELVFYVHDVIRRHRQAWSVVCEAYAPLRIAHAKRTIL
jgi:hypothetical protein